MSLLHVFESNIIVNTCLRFVFIYFRIIQSYFNIMINIALLLLFLTLKRSISYVKSQKINFSEKGKRNVCSFPTDQEGYNQLIVIILRLWSICIYGEKENHNLICKFCLCHIVQKMKNIPRINDNIQIYPIMSWLLSCVFRLHVCVYVHCAYYDPWSIDFINH